MVAVANEQKGRNSMATIMTPDSAVAQRAAPFSSELAEELIAEYGSPLYVYDGELLRSTISRITRAVPYSRTRFHFASVTNGNISLMKIYREAGWGLHANTPGDVYLGLHAGFDPADIVYSGSNLSSEEMEQMIRWQVGTLNLDSLSQLELFCNLYAQHKSEAPPRIGFRLNLPDVTGQSRIGVRPSEFPEAISIADSFGVKISGIHFYRGTGTNSTHAFTEAIEPVIEAGMKLIDWQYLDFGGGFGYQYREERPGLDWEVFGNELSRKIESLGRPVDLIIEPGRASIAGCATLLARVVSVKWQDEKQIVGVDTTIANITVLSVHGGHREIAALKKDMKEKSGERYVTDVCGNTTFSRDYLGRRCSLPAMQTGDVIAILDSGAYGYAMSSHFLHRPRPAEVLLESNSHRLIRKLEGYEVLTKFQIFENDFRDEETNL
jgi:diaminopimelate decarboxylase